MRKDPMAHPQPNPITSAEQYGLMAAIASGATLRQDVGISQELAREMIRKTPRRLRSKFAAELAQKRHHSRNPILNPDGFNKLNSFLGEFEGKVYYFYEDREGIYGIPIKKQGNFGDSEVRFSDDYNWSRAHESKVHDTIVIRVPWAGGTEQFVVYNTDTYRRLVDKPHEKERKKGEPRAHTYKNYYYSRVSTEFGMQYIAARDLSNLEYGKEDFSGKTKEVLFHKIDEYGHNPTRKHNNPSAEELTETWHGRPPEEVIDYEEVEHHESDAAVLAELEELAIILDNHEDTISIEFGEDPPMLVANVATDTLELLGGDQHLEFGEGWDTTKSEISIGHIYLIAYCTDKHHLEGSSGKPESYEHFFGEEYYKSRGYKVSDYKDSEKFFDDILEDGILEDAIQAGYLPTMIYDTVNEKVRLVGGRYTIEDVGLKD